MWQCRLSSLGGILFFFARFTFSATISQETQTRGKCHLVDSKPERTKKWLSMFSTEGVSPIHSVQAPKTSLRAVGTALTALSWSLLIVHTFTASWSFAPHSVLILTGENNQLAANETFTVAAWDSPARPDGPRASCVFAFNSLLTSPVSGAEEKRYGLQSVGDKLPALCSRLQGNVVRTPLDTASVAPSQIWTPESLMISMHHSHLEILVIKWRTMCSLYFWLFCLCYLEPVWKYQDQDACSSSAQVADFWSNCFQYVT